METKPLTLGSLFDGSGGFPLGGLLNGITPLWASEIEPFPIRVTTKRLPQMKHYGDVSLLNGADLPPVDIITFGSPCQDMSLAGKRTGLSGNRSKLFFDAVRIVKEMRCKTDGKHPRFVVWENVPGAFTSNKGEDFRCVLEALCRIEDETVSVPSPPKGKWSGAGSIVGDGFSLAWRTLDAQYWGVPQRRKRIYLVADLGGSCAGKILFESEGVPRNTEPREEPWERAAGDPAESTRTAGGIRVSAPDEKVLPQLFENHMQDVRYGGPLSVAQTIAARYGTGGNNQPFVVEKAGGDTRRCFDVRFTSEGTRNARQNCYETMTSRTIDTGGNAPDSNQGGVAVVAVQGSMIGRTEKNGPQGSGIGEDISFTLNTADRHAVAFSQDAYDKYAENEKSSSLRASGGTYGGGSEALVYSTSKSSYHIDAKEGLADTLMASDYKDPPTVAEEPLYIIRRLTPTECARLQGFPDWWCADLATAEPTEEEIRWWAEVFETHRKAMGISSKPKTAAQIIKWLKDPHTDSAEYKMWGNGVALPCVAFVLAGIRYFSTNTL